MNENPMVPDLALPEDPAERSLSGVADFGRVVTPGEIDVSHGTILYLEDVTVSFDGFRALNALTLSIDVGELGRLSRIPARCFLGRRSISRG
jgi:urea transport system ATP-binding protein